MSWFRWQGRDLILRLRVQPKASRDEFRQPESGRLRLRVTAPPVDGRANEHVLRLLAKAFGVSRSDVRLMRGEQGREKEFRITEPRRFPPVLEPILRGHRKK